MNQISLAVVNTIYFKTILTLIRQPMYHLGAEILVAVSKYENTLRANSVLPEYKLERPLCISTELWGRYIAIFSRLI